MQDAWQHLAIADVIHNYDSPGSVYPDYFVLPSTPQPNLAYYYAVSWLGYLMPLVVAGKVLLSLYVLAFPLSFLYLLRSFGRSRWLSLFSFPLIYNAMFAYGFVPFLLGMPLLIAGVGVYRRFVDSQEERPFNRYGALSCAMFVLAFFVHAHVYLLLGLLCFTLWILHRPRTPWGFALKAWPVIPSLALFVPWFIVFFVGNGPGSSGTPFADLGSFFDPTYYRPGFLMSHFFHFIGDYFKSDTDDALFLVTMLVAALLMIGRRSPDVSRLASRKLAPFDLEVLTLVIAVSVIALPIHIKAQDLVSPRHIVVGLLFFFGWLGFDGVPKFMAVLSVVVLTAVHLVGIANIEDGFHRFEVEMDGLPGLFLDADGGRRLLVAADRRDSRETSYGVLDNMASFYPILRGGITDLPFARYAHNPVRFRPGMAPPEIRSRFSGDPAWRYYDYVLVRKSAMPNARAAWAELDPVADVADWSLFRVSRGPLPRPSDALAVAGIRQKKVPCEGAVERILVRPGGVNVLDIKKNVDRVLPAVRNILRGWRAGTRGRLEGDGGRVGRPIRRRDDGRRRRRR